MFRILHILDSNLISEIVTRIEVYCGSPSVQYLMLQNIANFHNP
jgi:hypothetical protein